MAALLTAMPDAARAQQRGTGGEDILVTGSRDRRDPVAAFVDAATVATGGQIARFAMPVCPAGFGLPPEHNRTIEARLREIAEYLGLGAGGGGCRPNLVVIVADRGEDFVHRLRRDRPELFSALEPAAARAVMRLAGPVRAWQVIEPRGADGRPMERISMVQLTPNDPGRPVVNGYRLTGVVPSLTSRATRRDLALSFIVFDLAAIEGLSLLQIADHAAMRALARTEGRGLPARRSILTLFQDRDGGAPELTNWDAAYLRALYRTNNAASAHQQRSNMARTMRRELDSPPPGEEF